MYLRTGQLVRADWVLHQSKRISFELFDQVLKVNFNLFEQKIRRKKDEK